MQEGRHPSAFLFLAAASATGKLRAPHPLRPAMAGALSPAGMAPRVAGVPEVATVIAVAVPAAVLTIMLLAPDRLALAILGLLDAALLESANVAVCSGTALHAVDGGFAMFHPPGLARRQFAAANALRDALLLVDVARDVCLHALRGGGVRVSPLHVVLLPIDVATQAILRLIDVAGFVLRDAAIAQRPGFHVLDAGLTLFESGGFAGAQLPALQALLDALLLVDVALDELAGSLLGLGEGAARGDGGERQDQFRCI